MPIPLSNQASYTAFSNLAANGSTSSISVPMGGAYECTLFLGTGATWGAGTITPQESFDGGTTWLSHPSFTVTSGSANSQIGRFTFHAPLVRFTLSGATSPSLDLRASVELIRSANIFSATFAANGSSTVFQIPDQADVVANTTYINGDPAVSWGAFGTWGSGTLALQVSPDGGTTWFNVDTLTANGKKLTKPVTQLLGRLTLTGATSPALTAYVYL